MIVKMLKKIPLFMIVFRVFSKRRNINKLVKKNRDVLKRNIELKGLHVGKRCFIIATGPSLTIDDLELLEGEYTFGVNSIFKVFEKTNWRPTFYCLTDSAVYESFGKEILDYHFDTVISNINQTFIAKKHYKVIVNTITRIYRDYPFFSRFKSIFPWTKFSNDITKYIYSGDTVVYNMIQVAVWMGFKEIYLLGTDTNYKTKGYNHSSIVEYTMTNKDRLAKQDTASYRMIESYKIAKKKSLKSDFKIYNATRGGTLEVFQRVNLDSVISNFHK